MRIFIIIIMLIKIRWTSGYKKLWPHINMDDLAQTIFEMYKEFNATVLL